MKRYTWLEWLMNCILMCLVAGSLSTALLKALFIPVGYLPVLLITIGLFLILRLVLWNKWTMLSIIPVAVLSFGIARWSFQSNDWWHKAVSFIQWQIRYIGGLELLEESYIPPTLWLWTLLICTLFYVLLFKVRLFILPFALGSALLLTLWFLGHQGIVLYIWLFALGGILLWGSNYHRSLSTVFTMPPHGLWQACALPLALVIVLTARWMIPADTTEWKWAFLVNHVQRIEQRITDRYGFSAPRQPFRLTETGFPSSHDQLGGPVLLSGDLVLQVTSPLPLYLRGSILNEYISTGWRDTIQDMRFRFADDAWLQTRHSTYDYDEEIWQRLDTEEVEAFFPEIQAEITHTGIHSSVLFNAQRLKGVSSARGASTPYYNTKGETFTSRDIAADEPYTITARIPNLTNQDFREYLIDYIPDVDWREPLPELLWRSEEQRQKLLTVQDKYLRIPDTVPQRVYELADELTADQRSTLEKVLAIQDYLQNHYAYTLVPPFTPRDHDFVDYFLFELGEGYCTYFATAMAVMGRAAGIPSRYVEGFLMPSNPNREGIYEVRKLNGHAWVEVYFPQVGWIPFDPTPPGNTGETTGAGAYSGYDPYWEMYWQRFLEQQNQEAYMPELPDWSEQGSIEAEGFSLVRILLLTGLCLLALLLLLSLGLTAGYRLHWRRIHKGTLQQQLHTYYHEILWLLRMYGSPLQQGETPYAYAARVDQWLINPEGSMMDISSILIASEFGHDPVDEEDIRQLKAFHHHLRSNIGDVMGRVRFINQLLIHWLLQGKWSGRPSKQLVP